MRSLYYLYCYIYENLNKNYPKLDEDKKYILNCLCTLLEFGYVIDFLSIIFSLMYYVIIAMFDRCYRCGCSCNECIDKNCLNCSYGSCKTYKKFNKEDCTCKCEECQPNKRCYLCKGSHNCSFDYCDYCCDKKYCEINKEIKKYERIFGLFFDGVIFLIFGIFIKMMIDPFTAV